MDKRLENSEANLLKASLAKSDKALNEFLEKYDLRREMDVDEIYLASQHLTDINPLERFKKLNILWLQSNKIKKLPFIKNCYNLSEIYLQHNFIQSIEYCFRDLTNLQVIFLQSNQLSDLNSAANELSYLKNLRNLNLFDNPIELEKDYRQLMIYKIPSLVVFDRNTLEQSEKKRSIKIYEPERTRINAKHAFLRSIQPYSLNTHADQSESMSARASMRLLKAINTKDKSSIEKKQDVATDDLHNFNRNNNYFRTSIKEFSYFDWSKVKLYDKTNQSHFNNNSMNNKRQVAMLNRDDANDVMFLNSTSTTSSTTSLNQASLSNRNKFNQYIDNSNFYNNEKILPQVITIRFT